MSCHVINFSAIDAMQRGDFEEAASLLLDAVKLLKDELNSRFMGPDEISTSSNATHENRTANPAKLPKAQNENFPSGSSTSDHRELVDIVFNKLRPLHQRKEEFRLPYCSFEWEGTSAAGWGFFQTPSMSDAAERIYTSAIATFPRTNYKHKGDQEDNRDDEMLLNVSLISGSFLYNTGLCFHLQWLTEGQSWMLGKALHFYETSRVFIQTAFHITGSAKETCNNIMTSITQQGGACWNAAVVSLALANNMSAIFHELALAENVHQMRTEMRQVFELIDPASAFEADSEAYVQIYMNAFFYQDNKDMRVARAA